MKRSITVGFLALTLVGCGTTTTVSGEPSPAPKPVVTPTPTWTQPPPVDYTEWKITDPTPADLNERGNHVMKIGDDQVGKFLRDDGSVALRFQLTDMRGPINCDADYPEMDLYQPQNGQFIELAFSLETFDDPTGDLASISLTYGWEYISPDGTSLSANQSVPCNTEYVELRPNRKYETTIMLDIPADAEGGYLVWNPLVEGGGYEWKVQL